MTVTKAADFKKAGLDVIVRLHDIRRVPEFSRSLFSLVCSNYRPLHVQICVQRFSQRDLAKLHGVIQPLKAFGCDISLHNFVRKSPKDARSELLNVGIKHSKGRYLAFLDYDDIIFPDAYGTLIEELKKSGAGIAFGGIEVSRVAMGENFSVVTSKVHPFEGKNIRDLLMTNFCPIHSYVLDRKFLAPIKFKAHLTCLEDYYFLLQFCAKSRSSFAQIKKKVGCYNLKNDGSNTVIHTSEADDEKLTGWAHGRKAVAALKARTLLSRDVQKQAGLKRFDPKLTIGKYLDAGSS